MDKQKSLDHALKHLTAGRLPHAKKIYQKILRADPNQPVALHLLGVIVHQGGKSEHAIDLITKAVAVVPDYAAAHNSLGNVFLAMKKTDEAVASYHRALAAKPGYVEAHGNLGLALFALGKINEATTQFYRALEIAPDYAGAHNGLGNVLRGLERPADAVAHYRKALAVRPDFAEACNGLGLALFALEKQKEAAAQYRRAIALKPDFAEAHNNLGILLQSMEKMADAVTGYRRALEIKPDYAAAHNNLGNALHDLGKMDEAAACYRRALAITPDYAEAHRHLAMSKKFSEYDNDLKAMEEAYAVPSLKDLQRMHLAFGLGKAFEDLRRYEKAFGFFLTGNTVKRQTYTYSIESDAENFAALEKLFVPALFDTYQAAGSTDKTPIFILGMLRSGSTLVEQILAAHPKVYGAGEVGHLRRVVSSRFTEISDAGFAESLSRASVGDFSSAGNDYIATIRDGAAGAEFITDKMLFNFRLIGMIKLMLPRAKIIHCRRDPLDTCLSIFKNDFSSSGNLYAYDLGELGRYYNLYRDLMGRWHGLFPGFIYDIHYEEVVADQEGQSRALLAHCGLEWDDACLAFYKTDRAVHTASAAQVRRPIHKDSVQSWKRYEKQLAPLLEVLNGHDAARE